MAEAEEEGPQLQGEEEGGSVEIFVLALKGLTNSKIMKVEGRVEDSRLMMLIESGSTHSFLDEGTAKRLKCPLIQTQPLLVTVANGSKVISKLACVGFFWEMQGERFEANLRLLKLGGFDVVLGVDWMKQVSPICFDFNRMEAKFEKKGKLMTLTGSKELGVCKMIVGRRL